MKRLISLFLSLALLIYLILNFYVFSNTGFKTEILKLNFSAFPFWIDIIIFVTIIPFLFYVFLTEIFNKVFNF